MTMIECIGQQRSHFTPAALLVTLLLSSGLLWAQKPDLGQMARESAQMPTQQKYTGKHSSLKGKYANLVQLGIEGPAVYLVHTDIDMLGYDSLALGKIALKFDELVKPVSDKDEERVALQLAKGEDEWLGVSGLKGGEPSGNCNVLLNINVRSIKIDDQKLAESKKYRVQLYGSAVLEMNFIHQATGELLSVVVQGVPLLVKQRHRGNRERKIVASLPRSISGAIDAAFDYIAPAITERMGGVEPVPGCDALIAKSWAKKHISSD